MGSNKDQEGFNFKTTHEVATDLAMAELQAKLYGRLIKDVIVDRTNMPPRKYRVKLILDDGYSVFLVAEVGARE